MADEVSFLTHDSSEEAKKIRQVLDALQTPLDDADKELLVKKMTGKVSPLTVPVYALGTAYKEKLNQYYQDAKERLNHSSSFLAKIENRTQEEKIKIRNELALELAQKNFLTESVFCKEYLTHLTNHYHKQGMSFIDASHEAQTHIASLNSNQLYKLLSEYQARVDLVKKHPTVSPSIIEHKLKELTDREKAKLAKLKDGLLNLHHLIAVVEDDPKFSTLDYRRWATTIYRPKITEELKALNIGIKRSERIEQIEHFARYAFIAVNITALAISLFAYGHIHAGIFGSERFTDDMTLDANSLDGLMILITGIIKCWQGEYDIGLMNIGTGATLTATTLAGGIGHFTGTISPLAASGLMGFSYAVCMFAMGLIEQYQINQCEARIQAIKDKVTDINKQLANPELSEEEKEKLKEQKKQLQTILLTEIANREDHKRARNSWFICGVAMAAVAVIAFIALSGATFGALPLATLVIAAFAVAAGWLRKRWAEEKDHTERLGEEGSQQLISQFNDINNKQQVLRQELGLDLNHKVTVKTRLGLSKEISFHDYIQELIVKNPEKARNIIFQLNKFINHDQARPLTRLQKQQWIDGIMESASQHRSWLFDSSHTTGSSLLNQLPLHQTLRLISQLDNIIHHSDSINSQLGEPPFLSESTKHQIDTWIKEDPKKAEDALHYLMALTQPISSGNLTPIKVKLKVLFPDSALSISTEASPELPTSTYTTDLSTIAERADEEDEEGDGEEAPHLS